MAITNATAQKEYQKAVDALNKISRSRTASNAQKKLVRRKRDKLTNNFIGQNIADVNARTAKYQEFIVSMTAVVATLNEDALLKGVKDLTGVLDLAAPLLNADSA